MRGHLSRCLLFFCTSQLFLHIDQCNWMTAAKRRYTRIQIRIRKSITHCDWHSVMNFPLLISNLTTCWKLLRNIVTHIRMFALWLLKSANILERHQSWLPKTWKRNLINQAVETTPKSHHKKGWKLTLRTPFFWWLLGMVFSSSLLSH